MMDESRAYSHICAWQLKQLHDFNQENPRSHLGYRTQPIYSSNQQGLHQSYSCPMVNLINVFRWFHNHESMSTFCEHVCQMCGLMFPSENRLKEHEQWFHENVYVICKRPHLECFSDISMFKCSFCQLNFQSQMHLNLHAWSEHIIFCLICKKKFSSRRSLEKHLSNHI